MLKKISVKLQNDVGIKLFGVPIRSGYCHLNLFNIRQIYKLLSTRSVREVWEHNEDNTKRVRLTINNYKDTIDWSKVEPFASTADKCVEAKKEEPTAPVENNTPEPGKVETPSVPEPDSEVSENKEDEVPQEELYETVNFDGKEYEKINDTNYDPEFGIDPDNE